MDFSTLNAVSQILFSKDFHQLELEEKQSVLAGLEGIFEPPSRSNNKRNWWIQILLDKIDRNAGKDRASRGRSYWRKGNVGKRLTIASAFGSGTVRGSSSGRYHVAIHIDDRFKDHMEPLATAIARNPAFYVDFREGRLNPGLSELTLENEFNLFKDLLDLEGYCNCYDWESTCKHVVALANAIADKIQDDLDLALTFLGFEPKAFNEMVSRLRDGGSKDAPQRDPDSATDSFGWPAFGDIGKIVAVRRYGKVSPSLISHLGDLEKQAIDPAGLIPKNRITSAHGSFGDVFAAMYGQVGDHAREG